MARQDEVVVVAKDLPRLHKFYSDALGLATLAASPDVVRLDAGETVLVLERGARLPATRVPEPKLFVADVRAARVAVAACGGSAAPGSGFGDSLVSFIRKSGIKVAGLTPVGTVETFTLCSDPEGNTFEIVLRRRG